MTLAIQQALTFACEQLTDSDTPALDAEYILLFCLKASRNILFTDPEQRLTLEQERHFKGLLERRGQGEPVAYLLGTQGFWDLNLLVAPHTLIPRGDTESLIDWVLAQDLQPQHILDLGTGTGALALALASEFPAAHVIGVDRITEAVKLATDNKQRNHISNAHFLQSDWFAALGNQKFDLIVSNPPYIDEDDVHLQQGDVRFEPSSALVAEQDGFADLFHIGELARDYLTPGGCLLMEHGWQQASRVQQHLRQLGFTGVASGVDLGNRERFTFGFFEPTS
ncbi:MAG: peptide chain release factor N(5)-glutamine methyltransferase [Bermanella sp.]